MDSNAAVRRTLLWLAASLGDLGGLKALKSPRVQWGCSAAFAKSSHHIWDKLLFIWGLMRGELRSQPRTDRVSNPFRQTWVAYMFIILETGDPKQHS